MGDLSLVGSVWGVPVRVLKNISSDHTGDVSGVEACALERFVNLVSVSKISHVCQEKGLRMDCLDLSALVLAHLVCWESNGGWNSLIHEFLNRLNSKSVEDGLSALRVIT